MAAPQGVMAAIDAVIGYFNTRKLDLPDAFFDRKTQFVINGAPFETLLSATPNDPLVLMLARGPAGYRFTVEALQHAVPDAKIERGEVGAGSSEISVTLWLSGRLRDTREPINSLVSVTLRLTEAGLVNTADAVMDASDLEKIRQARLSA
jgi:hypothetical protein